MQDKKANENLKNENPKLKVEEKLEQQKSDKKDPGLQQKQSHNYSKYNNPKKKKRSPKKLTTTEIIVIDIENQFEFEGIINTEGF